MWNSHVTCCLVVVCSCFLTAIPSVSADDFPYILLFLGPKIAALFVLLDKLVVKINHLMYLFSIFLPKRILVDFS